MKTERVDDPPAFFSEKGGLHDVGIQRINFDSSKKTLSLSVDDIDWNSEGFPEYKGERPCTLVFHDAKKAFVDVDNKEGIRIGDAEIQETPDGYRLEIDLNLGGGETTEGRRSITTTFASLELFEE